MEICFLVKGRQTYRVDNRDYSLRGGDLFITFPDERHSTGGSPEEKGVLYWMILQMPRSDETFLGLPPAQGHPLMKELLTLKTRHFRGSWDMKELLDDITVAYHGPPFPLRATLIANRVGAFLLRVIECARAAPAGVATTSFHDLLRYIEENLSERFTIPALATRAGLSVSRFKARFREETGVPPVEYILRAKIEEAKRRLARGDTTVTATAFALGFPSSQYFATVFKRFTGQRPSGQRKSRSSVVR
jgi:AraC-like DNA-binding protein